MIHAFRERTIEDIKKILQEAYKISLLLRHNRKLEIQEAYLQIADFIRQGNVQQAMNVLSRCTDSVFGAKSLNTLLKSVLSLIRQYDIKSEEIAINV